MVILQEIINKFDTEFKRGPHTDHSGISRIEIARPNGNGQYTITTWPKGIGAVYFPFEMELEGVERIIGNSAPTRVRIGRNHNSLIKEEDYVEPDNPDYGLFERLLMEIQGLTPTLKELLEAYVPGAGELAHFQTSSTSGSVFYDHNTEFETHHRGSKFLVADEEGNGFFVELDATSKVKFGELVGDVVYHSGQVKPVKGLVVVSGSIAELNQEQLDAFTELHREVRKLYQ